MALTKIKHHEGDVTTQILKIIFHVFPEPWFFKFKKTKTTVLIVNGFSHILM